MEQRQDYIEKQINNLGLFLSKILSDPKSLDEEGAIDFFSLVKEQIGIDPQSTDVSEELLSSLADAGRINRDNIADMANVLLLLENNGNASTKVLKNVLVMLNYLQSRSRDYSFDLHLKMRKIEEKLTD